MSAILGHISVTRNSLEFEWKIPDFFSLGEKYNPLKSPEFEFLGAKWNLEFTGGCVTFLQLYIQNRLYCTSDLLINYTFGIKCFDGATYRSASGVQKVQEWDRNRGTKSLCLGDLQQNKAKIAPQDILKVFCSLSIKEKYCENTTSDSTTKTEISEGMNSLEKNFKDLLTSGEDSDVIMKVRDREFRAHRAILKARSIVFSSMFRHDMKERGCGTVDITDCDPQAFEQFLLYVYTGKVDCLSTENVCQLYQVAEKYDVHDLKTECVKYMEKNLSTDNFCDVISLALQHKESSLVETVTQFFVQNAREIVVTVSWLSFLKKNPVEANELTIKMLNFVIPGKKS